MQNYKLKMIIKINDIETDFDGHTLLDLIEAMKGHIAGYKKEMGMP